MERDPFFKDRGSKNSDQMKASPWPDLSIIIPLKLDSEILFDVSKSITSNDLSFGPFEGKISFGISCHFVESCQNLWNLSRIFGILSEFLIFSMFGIL